METSPVREKGGVTNSAFVMDDAQSSKKDEDSTTNASVGIEFQTPGAKRFFLNPKVLLVSLCFASLIQGIVVNGFVNVVISTLEKRFHLSSRETGVIASSYDLGSMLCVVPLSYLGGRIGSSKPRYISLGLVLMGLGSFVFSLPHFVSGRYLGDYIEHLSHNTSSMVSASSNNQVCLASSANDDSTCEEYTLGLANFKYIIIFGQILHGIGASPLVTLGNTLLDESVGSKLAPLYIGIFSTFFVIGPAVGFLVGGQLLNVYTDFYMVPIEEVAQIPKALWVGSWWLGFVVMGGVSIICAVLVGQFPSVLSDGKHPQEESNEFTTLKELPKALKALFVNPTYMLLSIGGAIDGFWLSSITAFLPKYLESQYFLTSAAAATIVGIVAVPSGGLGTFMGGWITKRLKLTRGGVIKLYLICQFILIPFGFAFLLSCQNPDFAGISVPYNSDFNQSSSSSSLSIDSLCNQNCSCSPSKYDPICGSNGLLYYSPCYAGCRTQINSTTFEDCECIPSAESSRTAFKDLESCNDKYECNYIVPFIAIIGFNIFVTFMASMTTIFATLRAVEPVHKSLALGLSTIILRVIGTIPGPMIFGAVIDMGCDLWKPGKCGEDGGNCLIYKNITMSISITIFFFVFKVLGIISYGAALFFSSKSHIAEPEKAE